MDPQGYLNHLRRLPPAVRALIDNHNSRIDDLEEVTPDLKTVEALRILESVAPAKGTKVTIKHGRSAAPSWVGIPVVNGAPTITMGVKEVDAEKIVIENSTVEPGLPFAILVAWADE